MQMDPVVASAKKKNKKNTGGVRKRRDRQTQKYSKIHQIHKSAEFHFSKRDREKTIPVMDRPGAWGGGWGSGGVTSLTSAQV